MADAQAQPLGALGILSPGRDFGGRGLRSLCTCVRLRWKVEGIMCPVAAARTASAETMEAGRRGLDSRADVGRLRVARCVGATDAWA